MAGGSIAQLLERAGFEKLEPREKLTIVIGAGFILCFLFLQFVITPYIEASRKLDNSIRIRKGDLVELQLLQQEYKNLKNETGGIRDTLQKRDAGFSLFSFLDSQAAEAQIKEFISYMKPSTPERDGELQESLVEMNLTGISLNQLVEYLKRIESEENVVSIKRISIQESGKEKGTLEVVIQIFTFIDTQG